MLCATGRAGLLGLAISLVSTVPEKVWYCKAKGYKPWLKPKQQDVLDNEQGGHTTWYDEPSLLKVSLHCTGMKADNQDCSVRDSIGMHASSVLCPTFATVCWAESRAGDDHSPTLLR